MSFYILKNDITGKLYKGQTQNLELRLKEHSYSHTKTTSNHARDWKLIYFEKVNTREEALKREKYFKSSAGRKLLNSKLIPESSTDTRPNVPFGTGGE
jgi:putative endonuclease